MKPGRYNILQGAQVGSEAKGKLSAWLVDKYQPRAITMTASPNSGHTLVVGDRKLVTYHLPVGAGMSGPGTMIILGPASVINPSILVKEIDTLKEWGFTGVIALDRRATIITPAMIKAEGYLSKIGSTVQGVGAARIARINRVGTIRVSDIWGDISVHSDRSIQLRVDDTSDLVHSLLDGGSIVYQESTQGAELCIDHGLDPTYCTTRNITTAGAMSEFGIPPRMVGTVYGVLRTFPIRVNNRDGYSGPYQGSVELDWETIGKQCGAPHDITEKTTTTKLVRRVFSFNWDRYHKFLRTCDPDHVCINFINYLDWSSYDAKSWDDLTPKVKDFVERLQRASGRTRVSFLGTGEQHDSMIDLEDINGG
jgi:adenylosuccinate synthase